MAGGRAFQIRPAGPRDLEPVVEFNFRLAAETERKRLDRAVLARGVTKALAEPDRLRYWVAEEVETGLIIGQAAITREWSDWRNGWLWWLQSVFVVPERRGQGVFRALFHQIREEGRQAADVIGIRLYVEQENADAQATYQRLGLKPGGYHLYEDLWTERFTRLSD